MYGYTCMSIQWMHSEINASFYVYFDAHKVYCSVSPFFSIYTCVECDVWIDMHEYKMHAFKFLILCVFWCPQSILLCFPVLFMYTCEKLMYESRWIQKECLQMLCGHQNTHKHTRVQTSIDICRQMCVWLSVICVVVCCIVLQCIAACCSVLQCVAVCHMCVWLCRTWLDLASKYLIWGGYD